MIIKQSVVDVLMFLFERYLDDDEVSQSTDRGQNHASRVTDERDNIQLRLEEMGFQNQEINQAFDWLEDLADSVGVAVEALGSLTPPDDDVPDVSAWTGTGLAASSGSAPMPQARGSGRPAKEAQRRSAAAVAHSARTGASRSESAASAVDTPGSGRGHQGRFGT